MTTQLLLAYGAVPIMLLTALLVRAQPAQPACARCGYGVERNERGHQICRCRR